MNGCRNCKYCKCYPGDSWTPDDYECMGFERDLDIELTDEEWDNIMTIVWENGEEWNSSDDPICPAWEEAPTPEDDYWARYAYEENRWDKDE